MKKHVEASIAIGVFLIMMIVSSFFTFYYAKDKEQTNKEKAALLGRAQASQLDQALSSYIQATDTLRIMIIDGQGEIHDFEQVAKQLYQNDTAFRSIQLAPDGDVQYVYPLKGNEEAFGSLFDDPDRRVEAEYARDQKKTTLAGPFELYQSGMGIVVRQPIYLTQGDQEIFWGFSIVVLNVPEIFHSTHMEALDGMGYAYELWRLLPDTNEKQVILSSDHTSMTDTVDTVFEVPESEWTLSIRLIGGWVSKGELGVILLIEWLISSLIAVLSYALMKNYRQKQKMVELSYHDYLTTLYNGRKMYEVLQKLIKTKKMFTLIYLDVDEFKAVNDTYGHTIGDELLKAIAHHIKAILHKEDYAFRIGGDEFVMIILSELNEQTIQNMIQTISTPIMLNDESYLPKLSFGYAIFSKKEDTMEALIQEADQHMYEQKRSKKASQNDDIRLS